ncbi:MAG: M48 family metalloprotease [Deltaproteobacteria bacterium]|nr:M48 family metalloprotease [Candidatus Tharpella aukensis]
MYQTFIFYIIVILIYTARPERPQELLQVSHCLLLILALFLLFYWIIRKRCRRLQSNRSLSDDRLPGLYDRLQMQLQIGAIIVFSGMVYGADLGALIELLPLVKRSEGLNNLLGLGVFFLLQIIIWSESHRYFAERILLIRPRRDYIKARLRFALGLVVPWLSILFIIDIFSIFLPQALQQALSHPLGEIVLFVLFLLVLTTAAPPLLIHLWQCKKLPESPLRQAIVELCRQQRVGYREIMLWPPFEGRMATAAVVGAFPFSRYLLITPDLMRLLNGDEIIAVMSHELGHVRYRHLLFFLVFFLTFFFFNYLYFDLGIVWLMTTAPIKALINSEIGGQEIFFSLLEMLPLLLLYLLFFRYVFGFFLRNFERQADLATLDIPGLGPFLVSAFEKLGYLLGQAGEKPNWHHFNIPQRINFLKAALVNPQIAKNHHQRLKKCLLIYLVVFLLILLPGIYWQQTGMAQQLNSRYLCQRLEHLVQEKPLEAELWFALSSLYIEIGQEKKALAALYQTRELNPEDPETLNNLAWLLLTIQDKALRDYAQAFKLAQEAAALKPAPHIIDTLAEAYWRQGDLNRAINLEKMLLERPEILDNQDHYIRQLEKFKNTKRPSRE